MAATLAVIGAPSALPAGPAATTPSVQVRVVEAGGFHWRDAAVGSLAAFGLTIVVGGVAVASRRE